MKDPVQLSFFFAWPLAYHVEIADKHMVARKTKYGPIKVHRNTPYGVWIVTAMVPIYGTSGNVGAAFRYIFPRPFFSGKEAWWFAKGGGGHLAFHTPLIMQGMD